MSETKTETAPSTTWYKVNNRYDTKVYEREVIKETEKMLLLANGNRVAKECRYDTHFRTREEAIQSIWDRLERAVNAAQRQHATAISDFEKFKASVGQLLERSDKNG